MILIGIAGGTGSGKTTFVSKLIQQLPADSVSILSQDAYYRDNTNILPADKKEINFDHPDAIEWELLTQHVHALKNHLTIQQPVYSMLTCTRAKEKVSLQPNKVVIVEGILILTNEPLRNELSLKIFIDADADYRLMRVVKRDMDERGRDVDEVMNRYVNTVRPMHEQFIEPSKKFADIIIPVGGDNHVAIEMLARYIHAHL